MEREDPDGPRFIISDFDPGKYRPTKRSYLVAPTLKISRTYSLSATLSKYFVHTGVEIRNNTFTDNPQGIVLHDVRVDEQDAPEPVEWRRGYYDKPRSWEQEGPGPGDENDITRRYSQQKSVAPLEDVAPKRTLEEKLSEKALQLSRHAAKKKRQLEQLKGDAPTDASADSSSSSSSSSDSD